jgi:hypothetical protein
MSFTLIKNQSNDPLERILELEHTVDMLETRIEKLENKDKQSRTPSPYDLSAQIKKATR